MVHLGICGIFLLLAASRAARLSWTGSSAVTSPHQSWLAQRAEVSRDRSLLTITTEEQPPTTSAIPSKYSPSALLPYAFPMPQAFSKVEVPTLAFPLPCSSSHLSANPAGPLLASAPRAPDQNLNALHSQTVFQFQQNPSPYIVLFNPENSAPQHFHYYANHASGIPAHGHAGAPQGFHRVRSGGFLDPTEFDFGELLRPVAFRDEPPSTDAIHVADPGQQNADSLQPHIDQTFVRLPPLHLLDPQTRLGQHLAAVYVKSFEREQQK